VVYTQYDAADRDIELDLSGFTPARGVVRRHRTSSTENLAELTAEPYADGRYRTTLRGESITTLVISGVQPR
jgi:hypothetical protein